MDIPGAEMAQTELKAFAAPVQHAALTGFADAHAYAQHIATLVRGDVQKVETSHTALVILGVIVGAILGAAGMWLALHG